MKVTKWVDLGQEVEIEIGADDIRAALGEAFGRVTSDPLGEEGPSRSDVVACFNSIAGFLNAITDEQITKLNYLQRVVIGKFLRKHAERFPDPTQASAEATK